MTVHIEKAHFSYFDIVDGVQYYVEGKMMKAPLFSYVSFTKLLTAFIEPRVPKQFCMRTKTCPKCGMEIPSDAKICPYCRSRLINDWGLTTEVDDLFGSVKKGFQQRSSNNGCMVVLPLILFFAASAFYLINTFI